MKKITLALIFLLTTSSVFAATRINGVYDKTSVGLGNVDNTSDANKPISTAVQTALDGKLTIEASGIVINTAAAGTTNDTALFQAAVDTAAAGNKKVLVPYRTNGYRIANLILKEGVELVAVNDAGKPMRDISTKTQLRPASTSGVMIVARSNTAIRGFLFYNPEQKYSLSSDSDSWNADATCIEFGDATDTRPESLLLENLAVVGFRNFFVQSSSTTGAEQLTARNITGIPLEIGFDLKIFTDIPRFEDIHFNLNSYVSGGASLLSGTTSNYYLKIAKGLTVFKFGRVDEAMLTNCFAYGAKRFLHFYTNAYTGDTNSSGGATLSNCSADVVHEGVLIERNFLNFGVKWTGGFITPVVKVAGSEQAAVKFKGTIAEGNKVLFSGTKFYGSTIAGLGDTTKTDSANYYFVWDGSGPTNGIISSSQWIDQYVSSISYGDDRSVGNYAVFAALSDKSALKATYSQNDIFLERKSGTDGPNVKFTNIEGDTWDIDNYGAAGSSKLRFTSGSDLFTMNHNGTFAAEQSGGGFSAKSPDGTKTLKFYADNSGMAGIAGGGIFGTRVGVPTAVSTACLYGQWAVDSSYLYICRTTNTWDTIAVGSFKTTTISGGTW